MSPRKVLPVAAPSSRMGLLLVRWLKSVVQPLSHMSEAGRNTGLLAPCRAPAFGPVVLALETVRVAPTLTPQASAATW